MSDQAGFVTIAARVLAVPNLADDGDICRLFPFYFTEGCESLRLAHALAEANGDSLTFAVEEPDFAVSRIEFLALLVARGLDPCKLAASVFREREDAAQLAALVVAEACKLASLFPLRERWRDEWPFAPDPEPSPAPPSTEHPASDATAAPRLPRGNIQACFRGTHGPFGPVDRHGWAECAGCRQRFVAPPNGPRGAFEHQPVISIELP